MNPNYNTFIITLILFAFLYCMYKINTLESKEKFTTNLTTQDQINTAVKRIYLADVEAIRLLSNFAIQLSQGGTTTVPGNVTFSGNTIVNGNTNINGTLNGQHARFSGTVHSSTNTSEGGSLSLKNSSKINKRCFQPGRRDVSKTLILDGSGNPIWSGADWTIYNMTDEYGDRLGFFRYNTDASNNMLFLGEALSLYDDGRIVINGDLRVFGNIIANNNIIAVGGIGVGSDQQTIERGSIIALNNITSTNGNITSTNGNITSTIGSVNTKTLNII